jgi:branched-chain amino acid transport system permease protein
VLLALGLNIVVGYAGLLDLGYVAFFAIGAYMYGLLASPHLTDTFPMLAAMFPQGMHTPLWIVIPAAAGWQACLACCWVRPHCVCGGLSGHRHLGFW